jgi:redox-sensitive bicupin YhaK (pirin superfamily)
MHYQSAKMAKANDNVHIDIPTIKSVKPMLQLRKSQDRGYADHGWLKSFHSFSFASYHDPQFMGWGNLRVINEDRIAAGMGFGKHGHRNMEIISYVLSGELAHQDSMGNIESIPPGDVQRMSAGSGVTHSEFNHAKDQTTHFLQIWIEPNVLEITPSYEQKTIPLADKEGKLRLIASPDGKDGSLKIFADARVYAGLFDGAQTAQLQLDPTRKAYVHLIKGSLVVNGQKLTSGDALLIENESSLQISDGNDAEVLFFDLSH